MKTQGRREQSGRDEKLGAKLQPRVTSHTSFSPIFFHFCPPPSSNPGNSSPD